MWTGVGLFSYHGATFTPSKKVVFGLDCGGIIIMFVVICDFECDG